ncbi:MAG: hypothetical protein K0A95_07370 [Chromatiales bacterium]|nr:hypothetical protein [Gammaproteobacteria bacterium]MBW6476876.1 hypothetical protein [Chromatiales bacterium]
MSDPTDIQVFARNSRVRASFAEKDWTLRSLGQKDGELLKVYLYDIPHDYPQLVTCPLEEIPKIEAEFASEEGLHAQIGQLLLAMLESAEQRCDEDELTEELAQLALLYAVGSPSFQRLAAAGLNNASVLLLCYRDLQTDHYLLRPAELGRTELITPTALRMLSRQHLAQDKAAFPERFSKPNVYPFPKN